MRKFWKNEKTKLNDRGAGMALMIVAIGLSTLLVSVLLMVSLYDYQMKTTEAASKDNFYSAEAVLDQIQTGLRYEASNAASGAYQTAVAAYGVTRGADNLTAENTRILKFKSDYISSLESSICDGAGTGEYYVGGLDTEYVSAVIDAETGKVTTPAHFSKGLARYVNSEIASMIISGEVKISYNRGANASKGTIVINDNGMVLKDITIDYLGENGYYDRIVTDIVIGYPDISLKEASIAPNAVYYTLIADNGILVKTGASAQFKGEIFAGAHENETHAEADANYMKPGSGLELKIGSSLTAEMGSSATKPDHFIVEGNTEVDGQSSLTLNGGQFWTDNINLYDTSKFTTGYENLSFISDDLTSNGNNAEITLEGSYYGYAGGSFPKVSKNENDPEYSAAESSSAIVINGKNTKVNLLMDTLNLYGNSYLTKNSFAYEIGEAVNGSYMDAAAEAQNVLLGTSLSVKTDQIVYLAPAECLTLRSDSTKHMARNPMLSTEYTDWAASVNVVGAVNTAIELPQLGGLSIADALGDTSDSVGATVIWRKIGSGANSQTVAYVYLKFSNALSASKYYEAYVNASKTNLQKYASQYNNTIKIGNQVAEISTAGALQYNIRNGLDSGSFEVIPGKDMSVKYGYQGTYWNRFQALRAMLVTNIGALKDDQLNKSVFHNIIKTSEITGSEVFNVDGMIGIVTNEDVRIESGNVYYGAQSSELSKVRFILNTKDVYINDSTYTGSIITDGTVYITGSSKVICTEDNSGEVEVILRYEKDSDTKSLIEKYFINGANYLFGSSSSSSGENGIYVDFNELVVYSNWTKE